MTSRIKRRMLNRIQGGLGNKIYGSPSDYSRSNQEMMSENRSRAMESSAPAPAPAPAVQAQSAPAQAAYTPVPVSEQAAAQAAAPEQSAATPFQRPGVTFVEHDGKMVSADALNALKQTVGLLDQDLTYDADGSGTVDLQDALAFMKYASGQDSADSPFFAEFYKSETEVPVVVPNNGPETAVTRAAGEHMDDQGNIVIPKFPFEATTLAMGEEDGSLPPFLDDLPIATTMAAGEEDGGFPGFGEITTLAVGEEDGGFNPIDEVTTTAIGEEDGGGGVINPIDTSPKPIVAPRPENPFFDLPIPIDNPIDTMPPVVAPQPRTYGNYTPPAAPVMGAGEQRTYGTTVPQGYNFERPTMYQPVAVDATAALDPLREGLGSFLQGGSANYLQSSGPRTSVFTRS